MKKLVALIFVLITIGARAQTNFGSGDSSIISRVTGLVLQTTKNKYHLANSNTVHENAIEVIYTDGTHKLIFEFLRIMSGGNKASNMQDTVYYTFNSVTGLFKDIFPYWKKYYQSDAKTGSTEKATHGKVITTPYLSGEMVSSFIKYGDYWELENRYSGKK